jgi:hypothetical protein
MFSKIISCAPFRSFDVSGDTGFIIIILLLLWNAYKRREREKKRVQEKRGWKEYKQPDSKKFRTRSMEKHG